jgi:CRISPR-associated protein Csm4
MPIFDLTMRGPLHLGEYTGIHREAALEWIPSDSLFSALISAWARQGMAVDELLEALKGPTPPWIISSAFPRAGEVRFYPVPPRLPVHSGMSGEGSTKAAKKIRWLSAEVYNTLASGETPDRDEDNFLHGGTVWITSAEYRHVKKLLELGDDGRWKLWSTQVVPHVTLDRVHNASTLFYTGRVSYGKSCGLWFALRGPADNMQLALNYLAEAGLGGLRSTGHGSFNWSETHTELPEVKSGYGLCISRYAPQTKEEIAHSLQAKNSAYKLVTVGGWCQDDGGHAWRRRAIRMVAEGALLPAGSNGGMVDVRPLKPEDWLGPQRPVYRAGWAFLIPAGKLVEAI